jgi:hypothetical protein
MSIPVQPFPVIEGSMTSDDGQTFYLKVQRDDGTDMMLAFPHESISQIVEHAAVQSTQGLSKEGRKMVSAFKTTSFEIGRGPAGEAILTLMVGQGGKVSFLMPGAMPGN